MTTIPLNYATAIAAIIPVSNAPVIAAIIQACDTLLPHLQLSHIAAKFFSQPQLQPALAITTQWLGNWEINNSVTSNLTAW
jgi:hypothetical protein